MWPQDMVDEAQPLKLFLSILEHEKDEIEPAPKQTTW